MSDRIALCAAYAIALLLFALLPRVVRGDVARIADDGAVHFYQFIDTPLTWPNAQIAATTQTFRGISGHLATITSSEENAVLAAPFAAENQFPYGLVGLFQPDGSPEPEGNFQWVTGEPLTYAHWSDGHPDNYQGNQKYVRFISHGRWDDVDPAFTGPGYFVEFESSETWHPFSIAASVAPESQVSFRLVNRYTPEQQYSFGPPAPVVGAFDAQIAFANNHHDLVGI